jgi:hypothetical protein
METLDRAILTGKGGGQHRLTISRGLPGLQFPVGNLEFFFEGQYYLGLSKINKVQSNSDDIKNNAISINLGLIFP